MKLTTFFILLACLHSSARTNGQKLTISMENVPVQKVFKEVSKQSGISILYNEDLFRNLAPVTIHVKNASIETVMDKCLANFAFEYRLEGSTIIVKQKPSVPNGIPVAEVPPPIDVKGRVVNEKGEPVVGATVTVKGSKKAVSTNDNGEFEIKGVDENATLVITGVNIEFFEVKVSGKSYLAELSAKTKVTTGETVTVNTGFQQIKPNELTGSATQIDKELFNRRVSTDVLSRLEGITSGLLIHGRNVDPLNNVMIRGRSTINANMQPLFVVDNFPFNGDINTINPNDVESVTVLKDAAASSIWGAYAGNGVIVLTMKKGKFNQGTKLSLNSSITVTDKPDLFYDQNYLPSTDYIEIERYLFNRNYFDADLNNTTTRPVVSPAVEIFAKLRAGTITQAAADAELNLLKGRDIRKEYDKYFYRKSLNQQYALNLSGGNEKSSYYLSGGYNKDLSSVVGDQTERISFNSNSSFRPLKNLELTGGLVYTIVKYQFNGMDAFSMGGKYTKPYPYALLADENGLPLDVPKTFRQSFVQSLPVSGLLNWRYVPLMERELTSRYSTNTAARLTTGIKYSLAGFTLECLYQMQKDVVSSREFYDQQSFFARDRINQFSTIVNNTVIKRPIPLGAFLSFQNQSSLSNEGRVKLMYLKKWGYHSIRGLVGANTSEVRTEGYGSGNYGYDPNTGQSIVVNYDSLYKTYPANSNQRIPTLVTGVFPYTVLRQRSFFANTSYSLKNRYTFYGSLRLDQANIFGVKKNARGTPLWSVGGRWAISNEGFYNWAFLPELNLKVSYGYNGNHDRTLSSYTTASVQGQDATNNLPFGFIAKPGNPELGWEKIGMINIGIEFSLKENILNGSLEFFHKNGKLLIGDKYIGTSAGFNTVRGNFSDMVGKGIDLTLTTRIGTRKLKLESTFMLSYAWDKVTRNEGDFAKRVGYGVNAQFYYKWGGLDSQGDPLGYLNGVLSKNYSAIIAAASANPELRVYSGNNDPNIHGSFRNTITWNELSISCNMIYKLNHIFRRNTIIYGAISPGHIDYYKRWQKPGDETLTNVPSMVFTDYPQFSNRSGFYTGSEILTERADVVRFQDFNLTYNLTRKQWKKLPMERVRLYIYSYEPIILWKANNKGLNPDAPSGFPSPSSISIGINADF